MNSSGGWGGGGRGGGEEAGRRVEGSENLQQIKINSSIWSAQRGNQKLSKICLALVSGAWLFAAIALIVTLTHKITWLTYLYYFSYIKLGVTLIKYIPQVSCQDHLFSITVTTPVGLQTDLVFRKHIVTHIENTLIQ